ncbi:MAG: YceI family protein [Cyclobacteriaceae bacterium]
MKTLKFLSAFLLLFALLTVVRCSEDEPVPPLVSVSGKVTFTDASGATANALGAVVYLANTTASISTISDENGDYNFTNLSTGAYTLRATYFSDNKNISGRMDGLTFTTSEPVAINVASTDVVQELPLVSTGQTGIEVLAANYAWTGSAYANTGAWTYDAVHSPLTFEFPYRGTEADFSGSFSQLSKAVFNFDPNNLATSSFNFEVDLASVNTRTPGGRDNRLTNMDVPLFSPASMFTELGCIMGTFGITADNATPTDAVPQPITVNTKRYAQFVSTSVAKLGDGYVAKGNVVFNGVTKPAEIWFKAVPAWTDPSNNRIYSGFEGRFSMKAKADYGITSSSLADAAIKIQISIVMYKQL